MPRQLSLIIAACILFISHSHASIWGKSVSLNDLEDQRTFSSTPSYDPDSSRGGLRGYWPYSFNISWDIEYNLNSKLWHYEYSLSASKKDISHFILELSDSAQSIDVMSIEINGRPSSVEGPKEWTMAGNQTLPNPFTGIKFDHGSNSVTYSFDSTLDPVWGNFYVRSGRDNDRDDDDKDDDDRDDNDRDDDDDGDRDKDKKRKKDKDRGKERDDDDDRDDDKDRDHTKVWDEYKVWDQYNSRNNKDHKFDHSHKNTHKDEKKDMWINAYNNALEIDGFESDKKIDFIVRPDGGGNPPVVPEPISYVLFIIGGATLGFRRFWKKRKSPG